MRYARPILLPARLTAVVAGAAAPSPPPVPPPPPPPPPPDPAIVDQERVRALLGRLAAAVEDLAARQRQPLEEVRQVAVELGMAVAARLVHEHIAVGAFGVEAVVCAALDRLPPQLPVAVRLHPDDLDLLRQRLGADAESALGARRVELSTDASLGRGDCKAQAGEFLVWSELRRSLLELREALLADVPFLREPAAGGEPHD